MLHLLKSYHTTWEKARSVVREDVDHIERTLNLIWDRLFGDDLKLKNDAINGDGGVIRTGDDGNVTTGDVLLSDLEDIPADSIVGRRSASAGPPEVLTTTSPISVSGTAVIHDASGVTPGTYGGASSVPVITVNSTGHITLATEAAISASTTGSDVALHTLCGGI